MEIETDTIEAPSFWACYLINGDSSGMEDREIDDANAFESKLLEKGWNIACPDGEAFFGSYFFPSEGRELGCHSLEYPIYREVRRETE